MLWFGIAAVLVIRGGVCRRGALRGILAIAGASLTANGVLKPLLPRRRPPAAPLPRSRRLHNPPTSSSFPSGHAASAAAFATAAALESPRTGFALAPLAAAVAYSRVHTGVHWTSDVVAGAAVGAGSALLTRRWWPVRGSDEAQARPLGRVPELPDGEGLVLAVNPMSGTPGYDPTEETKKEFPAATVVTVDEDTDLVERLKRELAENAGRVRALGAAGGDGTVAAVASVASRHRLPLLVVPTGTLNHFARDVGVYDLRESVDASGAGEAVAVTLGTVDTHRAGSVATRSFLNTASLGCYPDLVRLRERWQPRWGKWPAFAFALVSALRRATPLEARLDGVRCSVWTLFVGNGVYHPVGMVPGWRPRLDSGLLDVRWLRADLRWSRMRAFFALVFGALGHSRVYKQREAVSLDVRLARPEGLATDGEVLDEADRFTFRVAPHPVPIYRRNERNPRWAGRDRPTRTGQPPPGTRRHAPRC